MANATKITKVQKFNAIIKALEGVELEVNGEKFSVEEFANHEIDLINKKASAKKSKVSDETIKFMADVKATLEGSQGMTISEIIKATPSLKEFVPQKVTPIVTKLVASGDVVKNTVKGKSIYSLA